MTDNNHMHTNILPATREVEQGHERLSWVAFPTAGKRFFRVCIWTPPRLQVICQWQLALLQEHNYITVI
jgi:hypothetical protein